MQPRNYEMAMWHLSFNFTERFVKTSAVMGS
jgi:hypothetical protein